MAQNSAKFPAMSRVLSTSTQLASREANSQGQAEYAGITFCITGIIGHNPSIIG